MFLWSNDNLINLNLRPFENSSVKFQQKWAYKEYKVMSKLRVFISCFVNRAIEYDGSLLEQLIHDKSSYVTSQSVD